MAWTAQQWREHRRLKGVRPKNDEETELPERIFQQGKELAAMMMVPALDWPRFLFKDFTAAKDTTSPLFAGGGKKVLGDNLCSCGCKLPHNNAVSALDGEAGYRRILWFRTMRCKNKHLGIT